MLKKDYSGWSKEDLIKEINRLEKRKRYGIVWEDKPEEVATLCKEELPILVEDKKREIKTDGHKPINILIEGDNYHALSVLNYTHKGKIDIIYIDPPFNTGAKDWKYNNDYVDINDQWRHSKWLSMMSKRLRLAKSLLKNDGVLVCAIDDNEYNHLGCLLEEIFYRWEMYCITIIHNPRGIQGQNFSYTHEYAYFLIPNGKQVIQDKKRKSYSKSNLNLRDKGSESLRTDARNCFYPFFIKDGKIIDIGEISPANFHPKAQTVHRKDGIYEVWPIDVRGIERKWRYARQSVEDIMDILKPKKTDSGYEIEIYKEYEKNKTVWSEPEYNSSLFGTKVLHEILPQCDFAFPKSVYLTRECLYSVIASRKNAIVLDFFAGSGTTGHATLMLNRDDQGERTFILCTNNENNICTDVCYPRIKKVIEGYEKPNSENVEGLGGNLKYFKTDFVDAEPTDRNKKRLVDKSTEMLCLKEDCFAQIKRRKDYRIFTNNQGKLLGIIYDDDGIEPFKNELRRLNRKFVVYIFSLDESAREEEFEDVKNLVELKPIPAVILNVYKRIFK